MASPKTHTEVYFLRTVWVRREHILGDVDDGTNGIMRVIARGESHKINATQAHYMIVDETCLEVKSANRDAIEADLKQVREVTKQTAKKAA